MHIRQLHDLHSQTPSLFDPVRQEIESFRQDVFEHGKRGREVLVGERKETDLIGREGVHRKMGSFAKRVISVNFSLNGSKSCLMTDQL